MNMAFPNNYANQRPKFHPYASYVIYPLISVTNSPVQPQNICDLDLNLQTGVKDSSSLAPAFLFSPRIFLTQIWSFHTSFKYLLDSSLSLLRAKYLIA